MGPRMRRSPPGAALRASRAVLRALDNDLRLRILALLYQEREGLPYSEIATRLGLEDNSGLARHLDLLVGAVVVANEVSRMAGKIRSVYFITEWGIESLEGVGLGDPEVLDELVHVGVRPARARG